jgi:predicted phage terminase large subunit-like protein
MHNASQEIMVFTRWHEDDLIGTIRNCEKVIDLEQWSELDSVAPDTWVALNFEAIKSGAATEIDPRAVGEALWSAQHSAELLQSKRRLDPQRFECMYQGNPTSREGLLYSDGFATYTALPKEIVRYGNYTDTADMGDDYLCSACYAVDSDGVIYITDIIYTREPMEVTEQSVSNMLNSTATRVATVESNNGGRGFARAVARKAPMTKVEWFHQSDNKEARILSNSATVLHLLRFPRGWQHRWAELHSHLTTYRRNFRSNRWHDAADVITGIVERETQRHFKTRYFFN